MHEYVETPPQPSKLSSPERALPPITAVTLRRLIALVDPGAIEGAGDLRRPRFSEVRLPERGCDDLAFGMSINP